MSLRGLWGTPHAIDAEIARGRAAQRDRQTVAQAEPAEAIRARAIEGQENGDSIQFCVYTIWGISGASDLFSGVHHKTVCRLRRMNSACLEGRLRCGTQVAIPVWRKETWNQLHSRILIDTQGIN